MLHRFRSSFRDLAAEETDHPREAIEAALACLVRNKVETAYRRSDLFERRSRLMDDWAGYLADKSRDPMGETDPVIRCARSGACQPSRRDRWSGATPQRRAAWACTCQPFAMPI